MSKESENLSHHEQKRLEYLYSNYHYLNEKEQLEYQYLKQKSEGQIEQVVVPALEEDIQESAGKSEVVFDDLPVYPSRTRKSKAKDSGVEPMPKLKQSKKPKKKIRVKRVLKWLAVFLLLVISGMVIMFFKGLNSKPRGDAKPAVQEYFNGQKTKDGVNILILGTDGRIGESSEETRTDSIMVVNVNNKSGKVKMVSFMRDTLVHIDGVSQQSEPDIAEQTLELIADTARDSLTQMRSLLGLLRTDEATAYAPVPTLSDVPALVEQSRRAGLPVTFPGITGTMARTLPQGAELAAYRTVQEALTNALKHSPGAATIVTIHWGEDGLQLRVQNDPVSSAADQHTARPVPGSGNGLLGMSERIALYHGTLTYGLQPDGSWLVEATLPYRDL